VAPRHAHPAPPSNDATGSQESFCREGGTGFRVAPVPPRKSGAFDPSSASWPRVGVGTKGVPQYRAPRGFNAPAGGVEQRAGRGSRNKPRVSWLEIPTESGPSGFHVTGEHGPHALAQQSFTEARITRKPFIHQLLETSRCGHSTPFPVLRVSLPYPCGG
jgi:hypothetical protein